MRQLKFHERKLLKKVNLYQYRNENNAAQSVIIRRYRLPNREVYDKYNKVVKKVHLLINHLTKLPENDPVRLELTSIILKKLYDLGFVNKETDSLTACSKFNVSTICRRRFPVVLVRMKFAENLKAACTFIEHGHLRIGSDIITDPEYVVPRNMEDFITWVDSSKIKRTIMKYNDELDDFDLL
eukprot:TRINITY_DN3542_c0_g1_i1.p2 TRINITY_DN3542_c0_g1~~TRINITY_DN3542_c0_g1_i1.p2  ORF type:complete len:183 (+),score=41.45 TRINITY_DN3542_c0_g1_i1:582-1130(+)